VLHVTEYGLDVVGSFPDDGVCDSSSNKHVRKDSTMRRKR
jgi:hypothetical protein